MIQWSFSTYRMAKSIARNVVKEYLETSTSLSGKDLERGISGIIVYIKLGMVGKDDVDFEKGKIKMIRRICLKDNTVTFISKKSSSSLSPTAKPATVRIETRTEKLKRLLEQ